MNSPTASKPAVPTSLNTKADEVVRLENVSVEYRVPGEPISSFKEYSIRFLQGNIRHHSFWALRDVSLTVTRGEVFGLIGQNGAGKSTLLKLIARVLRPSNGRVWVRGRVAPLLEVGAGFHPELTGRENIFLNGAMLGFTRHEMEMKFPRIVDFAELGEFIEAPMRTYSSGMWARLGFAVATDTQPEILIVDEVLSVGDEAFQRKCSKRLEAYREQGSAIILVSHNMTLVANMCRRTAWLAHGQLVGFGDTEDIIQQYRQSMGITNNLA